MQGDKQNFTGSFSSSSLLHSCRDGGRLLQFWAKSKLILAPTIPEICKPYAKSRFGEDEPQHIRLAQSTTIRQRFKVSWFRWQTVYDFMLTFRRWVSSRFLFSACLDLEYRRQRLQFKTELNSRKIKTTMGGEEERFTWAQTSTWRQLKIGRSLGWLKLEGSMYLGFSTRTTLRLNFETESSI